jgi:hypothetical protein
MPRSMSRLLGDSPYKQGRLVLLALLIALCAVLLMTAERPAQAQTTGMPDPTEQGPYTVNEMHYDAGTVQMSAPNADGSTTAAFQHPLAGELYYPSGPGPWPALVFIHGNHSSCITGGTSEGSGSPCNTGDQEPIANYMGYGYLANNLASHGYVVMSLDADALTNFQTSADNGTFLRTQLISASMDLLFRWNDGVAPAPIGNTFTGKIEVERGFGIFGHSRGGEAVAAFPLYNRLRPSPGRKYRIAADFSLAPVDYERSAPYGTFTNGTTPDRMAFATLLPTCDGDVSNIQGARIYQRALHTLPDGTDLSPKIQFAVAGANHDYYNTIWWSDDGSGYRSTGSRPDAACGEDVPGNIRLSPTDQRTGLIALAGAFFRRYVGGETAFDPMMTGASGLPASACPQARGVDCADELKTTYFAPDAERRDVVGPDPNTALSTDALGGGLTGSGFQDPYPAGTGATAPSDFAPGGFTWCNPEPVDFTVASGLPTAARPCPLPPAGTSGVLDPAAFGGQANERESAPVNRSYGPQLALAWSGAAQLDASIPSSKDDMSGFKALGMDVAVNYFDPRNGDAGISNGTYTRLGGASPTDPHAADQNFDVVLTDSHGDTASVAADNPAFGTATEEPIGTTRRHILLNELRIPLTAFGGVDLSSIRKVSLQFGGETPSGSIQLANMRFQEPVNPPTGDPVIGPASSSQSDPRLGAALGLNGATYVPPAGYCADLRKPKSSLISLAKSARKLVVRGRAKDTGCAGGAGKKAVEGKMLREQVTIARKVKGGCRFVSPEGKLLPKAPCSTPYSLVAKGRREFKLVVPRKLVKGKYLLRYQALDVRGNLEPAHTKMILLGEPK